MSNLNAPVSPYFRISEAALFLRKYYEKNNHTIFIIPSGLDKEPLLDLISNGGSYFGHRPDIRTLSELYSIAAGDEARRIVTPHDNGLILSFLLKKLIDEAKDDETIQMPCGILHRGFVSLLAENIRDLITEGVDCQRLHDRVLGDSEDRAEPEVILWRLYSDYLAYLEENSLADNAQIPSLISSLMDRDEGSCFSAADEFAVIGFLSFTGSQRNFFKKLRNAAKCNFLIPLTALPEEDFRSGIIQITGKNVEVPLKKQTLKIVRLNANNTVLEYSAVARELALWRIGRGKFTEMFRSALDDYGRVGIEVPEKDAGLLENKLKLYRIAYSVQMRGNAGETLLGKMPSTIWSAFSSGWDTKETALMMADPLISPDGFDTRGAFDAFTRGQDAWTKKLSGCHRDIFNRICELCKGLKKGGTPREILRLWRDFVLSLNAASSAASIAGDDISLDSSVKDLSSVMAELDKKIAVMDSDKSALGPAAEVTLHGEGAISYLTDWSRTATLPIQLPQSGSVTVYAGMPPSSVQHDFWIMTEVDSNSWPGHLRESPLLRAAQLEKLNGKENDDDGGMGSTPHMPDIKEQRGQKEAVFRRLTATGRFGAILARSMTDSSGRPTGESPFLARLFDSRINTPETGVAWENEGTIDYKLSDSMPHIGEPWFADAEIREDEAASDRGAMPRTALMPPDEKILVNVSDIDTWNLCPYRYWCSKLLKIEPWARQIFDLRTAGSFMHRLWEGYWHEYAGDESKCNIHGYVLANWEQVMKINYMELATEERLRRHSELLRAEALDMASVQDEIEIRAKEAGRSSVNCEYSLSCEIDGVMFVGRCDRVDSYADGAVILDYKLGRAKNHMEELQLAAYASLLRAAEGVEPLGFCWLGQRDASVSGYFTGKYREIYTGKATSSSGHSYKDRIAEAEGVMKKMAAALASGKFPANYGAKMNGKSACLSCGYSTLCRLREAPYYSEESENDGGTEAGTDE